MIFKIRLLITVAKNGKTIYPHRKYNMPMYIYFMVGTVKLIYKFKGDINIVSNQVMYHIIKSNKQKKGILDFGSLI